MARKPDGPLRTGFTTGACATAATKAAFLRLLTGRWSDPVEITLPRGQTPSFALERNEQAGNWAAATIVKDAGDDPDVTHLAHITARVAHAAPGSGVTFRAGSGVGVVTKPGLPIPPGEAAINPVPRQMMKGVIHELASAHDAPPDVTIEISVKDGEALAAKTWNPRLGVAGGISILGTTGIVRPFSCAAWIASIHRGVDVARAMGQTHVAGATGATSEKVAQNLFDLPDYAMLDMGDFAGGMLKYIAKNPIPRVTIAGGFGKLTKLAQGALDLHSGRSQVDFSALAALPSVPDGRRRLVAEANTAKQALELVGQPLAQEIADLAQRAAQAAIRCDVVKIDTLIIDRAGNIIARG